MLEVGTKSRERAISHAMGDNNIIDPNGAPYHERVKNKSTINFLSI